MLPFGENDIPKTEVGEINIFRLQFVEIDIFGLPNSDSEIW